jgi:hypothetical protein
MPDSAGEPIVLPRKQPPARRRLLISAWGFLILGLVWGVYSVLTFDEGGRLGAIAGVVASVCSLVVAFLQFKELRKTPTQA